MPSSKALFQARSSSFLGAMLFCSVRRSKFTERSKQFEGDSRRSDGDGYCYAAGDFPNCLLELVGTRSGFGAHGFDVDVHGQYKRSAFVC